MKIKKLITIFSIFCIVNASAQNNDLSVANGTVKFNSIDAYESYANNPAIQDAIRTMAIGSAAVTTLQEAGNTSEDDMPIFLQSVLNTDNIYSISNYFIKIDVPNNRALVINSGVSNAYNDLVNNNTASVNMMVMSDDEQNAIEVLRAIDNGTLTITDYNNATPEIRFRWPWNRCSGQRRVTQKNVDVWDSGKDPSSNCPDQSVLYGADNKAVYQKFIFYFSLEAKMKSLRGCSSTNWILVPTHRAFLFLNGTVKFVKVNACSDEYNNSRDDSGEGTVISWRPYEGSHALTKYDFTIDFSIRHTWETTVHGPFHYHIVAGY